MSQSDQAARDLEYVRGAVEQHDNAAAHTLPAVVGVMWAAIVLIGCLLNDFLPQWSWLFWITAAPVGSMMCGVLSSRQAAQMGEVHARVGMLNGLHWSSLFWMPAPIVMLALTGRIDENTCGILFLLVSGIVWYLAGVHLDRRWMLPGIALVVTSGILVWVHKYPWTIAGIICAASILASFLLIGPQPAVVSEHE